MAAQQDADPSGVTPEPMTVLVVGSSDVRCEALAATIGAAGMAVTGPVAPDAGRLAAASPSGPPDVVVVDGSSGAGVVDRVLDAVAERWPAARAVVVTDGERPLPARPTGVLVLSTDHHVDDVVAAVSGARPRGPADAGPEAAEDIPAGLTAREVEVLALLATGKRNDDVAAALNISPHTVRSHLQSIHSKLGVRSRFAAVTRARRVGALRGPEALP